MAFPGNESCGASSLLSGTRTRSYGSLVKSSHLSVREKWIEHEVKPGDTLQGLALKYGVTMEQIKRANRLYTSDSIFLKKTLSIPVPVDKEDSLNGQKVNLAQKEPIGDGTAQVEKDNKSLIEESLPSGNLSAEAYLKKLDSSIKCWKEVAIKKIREGSIHRIMDSQDDSYSISSSHSSDMDKSCNTDRVPSPRVQQRSLLGRIPLSRTTRTTNLQDHEDEIFKL